ncbi:Gp138 family membrane-puncturing spike protein [Sessilibacter corallicola]|uniref:Gp138 family membrane-puncturing spike protein n=1 Tax=Sessilibacter corallicola TaxID=2904075 RepID=UPI001E47B0CD|nr:Gp138 family membrane-puncturing spike protein [Sessilibacter corallicola]MCE2029301.1 hypothetical protein [Sessilibacter corallicola]
MNTKLIDPTELHRVVFLELIKDLNTSIVGHVKAFDPETQYVQFQPGINQRIDGEQVPHDILINVPVFIYGDSDYFIENQILPNTEGVVFFSQRCIDNWKNSGGLADNLIRGTHGFNDGMFFPGVRSQPNKISNHANDGIRLRNKSGNQFIWLKRDGGIQFSSSYTEFNTGDFTVNANNFNVNADSFTHNNIDVGESHNHGGVDRGSGNTDPANA